MIDVHAHYLPTEVLRQAAAGSIPGVGFDPVTSCVLLPDGPTRPVPPPLSSLDQRDTWCSDRQIDLQVLSPWLDCIGDHLQPDEALGWCRAMNDTVAADIDGNSGFIGMAALPIVDGERSAAELRRCVEELGFVGGAIPTQVRGVNLDEVMLEPLYRTACELDVVLFVHPHRVLGADRMSKDFLNNICGNPFETTVAAFSMYLSGVFERFPQLKVLLAHCGGTLPMLAGRAAQASRAGKVDRLPIPTADAVLDCFHYDTVVHDPRVLAFALAQLGPDRVHLGTDLPFPMVVDDPVSLLHAAVDSAGGDPAMFARVTQTNPARLLGQA
jgi:aminocarboxymuconate-semialdehyde decarboxylase